MSVIIETRQPNLTERLIACAAHIATALSLVGIALAAAIWLTQRRRSPYVAGQARQAVLWQVMAHIVVGGLIAILALIALVALGGATNSSGDMGAAAGSALLGSVIGIYVLPLLAAGFFLLMSLVGAIAALLGRPYHYPLPGRMKSSKR